MASASRGGIYCRMSKSKSKDGPKSKGDPKSRGDTKIEQQEAMCRALADAHGVDVVKVYVDDGISAFTGKERPGWSQLLQDVEAGRLDVLLAQSEDRFTRQPMEKETLAVLCASRSVRWLTVNDGQVDPNTADGQFFATLRAGLARMESARKGERQRQANDHRAAAGRVRVGGPRPIGWQEDKVTVELREAAELRWAVKQILGGATVFSVVRAWNDKGFLTSKGKSWQQVTVKQVLTRPRMAGLVLHRGEVVKGVVGEWEPICSVEEWERLCAILSTRRQLTHNREPRHLLSGLVKCGCGEPMRFVRNGTGRPAYRCITRMNGTKKHLPHVTIGQAELEEMVTKAVVTSLLLGPSAAASDVDGERLARLHAESAEIDAQRQRLVQAVAEGVLDLSEVATTKVALNARAAEIEAEVARIAASNAQAALTWEARELLWAGSKVSIMEAAAVKTELRKRFEGLDLEQRRALVKATVDVTVHPGRGLERVEIVDLRIGGEEEFYDATTA